MLVPLYNLFNKMHLFRVMHSIYLKPHLLIDFKQYQ